MSRLSLSASASSNWMVAASIMPGTVPIYQQGTVYYALPTGQLQAIDFQTGNTLWTTNFSPPLALQSPVWVNGVLYLANGDGTIYALDPVTGDQLWSLTLSGNPLSTPQFGQGYVSGQGQQNVLYVMDAQNLYLVPLSGQNGAPPTPQTMYSVPAGSNVSLGSSLLYDQTNQVMVLNTSSGLTALYAYTNSNQAWTQAWTADFSGYVTPVTSAMGKVFVGTPLQKMAIVDLATGNYIQSNSLNADIEQPILVYPNSITGYSNVAVAYVPLASGAIALLDATSPTTSMPQLSLGTQAINTPLTVGDNLVYYGSADSKVYCFDITNPTADALSYTADASVAYVAGISAGTAYFGSASNLHSVDFADVLHQFNSQSQLMVDMVPNQPGQPQQIPSYQTHLILYDEAGNVRPNEAVKVWSATAAALMTQNQTYNIGPDTAAAFQADATGKVVLSVQASTNIQAGVGSGLSTPALMLWASFMDQDERILIYPDQRLHAQLQTITGTDLQNAAAFNQSAPAKPGTALLPSGFQGTQGASNATALANAINNCVCLKSPTSGVEEDDTSNKYLAYPNTMLGVSYCATPPDTTTRAPASGTIANWTLQIDYDDSNNASSGTFTSQDTAESVRLAVASFRQARGLGLSDSITGDLDDFIKNVVNGVEKVAQTAWSLAENELNAAITTAENAAYNFAVTTIEDAAHVVLGILKSIAADVESVLEALSWMFSWNDILATHSAINKLISGAFVQMQSVISTYQKDANTLLGNLATDIETNFNTFISDLGTKTLGATTPTDPNQAYSTNNGSNNYSVQGNWLFQKAMTGAVGPGGSISIGTGSGGNGGAFRASRGLAGDATTSLSDLMTTFLAAVSQAGESVPSTAAQTVQTLVATITDPTKLQAAQLATLFTDLETLATDLVTLAQDAVDAFCDLVTAAITIIQGALNQSIDIPVVSDLYKLLTGAQLTILDLFSLAVAIPTTIIYEATTGNPPFSQETKALVSARSPQAQGSAALEVQDVINTFSGLIYTLVDAVDNAMGDDSPAFLNFVEATLDIMAFFPFPDLTSYRYNDAGLISLWELYQFFPVVCGVYAGEEGQFAAQVSNTILPLYGIGAAIGYGLYAAKYSSLFFEPDGLTLAQNELGSLSYIASFARLSSSPEVQLIFTAACFFLDAGSALTGALANWLPSAGGDALQAAI